MQSYNLNLHQNWNAKYFIVTLPKCNSHAVPLWICPRIGQNCCICILQWTTLRLNDNSSLHDIYINLWYDTCNAMILMINSISKCYSNLLLVVTKQKYYYYCVIKWAIFYCWNESSVLNLFSTPIITFHSVFFCLFPNASAVYPVEYEDWEMVMIY